MKTEELKALGLTDEQVGAVMKSNGLDIEAEKTKASQVEAARAALAEQLKERDKQLAELQKSPPEDVETLKKQIADLIKSNADAQAAHEAELAKTRLDSAVDAALSAAKTRNAKAVLGLLDKTKIELGDDGKLKGLSEQLDALKKSDAYLFEGEAESGKPGFVGFKPGESGEGGAKPALTLADAVAQALNKS